MQIGLIRKEGGIDRDRIHTCIAVIAIIPIYVDEQNIRRVGCRCARQSGSIDEPCSRCIHHKDTKALQPAQICACAQIFCHCFKIGRRAREIRLICARIAQIRPTCGQVCRGDLDVITRLKIKGPVEIRLNPLLRPPECLRRLKPTLDQAKRIITIGCDGATADILEEREPKSGVLIKNIPIIRRGCIGCAGLGLRANEDGVIFNLRGDQIPICIRVQTRIDHIPIQSRWGHIRRIGIIIRVRIMRRHVAAEEILVDDLRARPIVNKIGVAATAIRNDEHGAWVCECDQSFGICRRIDQTVRGCIVDNKNTCPPIDEGKGCLLPIRFLIERIRRGKCGVIERIACEGRIIGSGIAEEAISHLHIIAPRNRNLTIRVGEDGLARFRNIRLSSMEPIAP